MAVFSLLVGADENKNYNLIFFFIQSNVYYQFTLDNLLNGFSWLCLLYLAVSGV